MSDEILRYDMAVAELFANGADMVVVVNQEEALLCRGIILDGLRHVANEPNLERAAGIVGEEHLSRYLVNSAIHGTLEAST